MIKSSPSSSYPSPPPEQPPSLDPFPESEPLPPFPYPEPFLELTLVELPHYADLDPAPTPDNPTPQPTKCFVVESSWQNLSSDTRSSTPIFHHLASSYNWKPTDYVRVPITDPAELQRYRELLEL